MQADLTAYRTGQKVSVCIWTIATTDLITGFISAIKDKTIYILKLEYGIIQTKIYPTHPVWAQKMLILEMVAQLSGRAPP